MINYFYRIQIPDINSILEKDIYTELNKEQYLINDIQFIDFDIGYIEANSTKEARTLLEEKYSLLIKNNNLKDEKIRMTMCFTNLDNFLKKYNYLLKIYPANEYWDNYWFEDRECTICGRQYNLIDRNIRNGSPSANIQNIKPHFCSSECNEIGSYNYQKILEEEKIRKTMEDNNGIYSPCIYKITNKQTNKVYIGQTTQYIAFRWYQHFSNNTGTKFHKEINEYKLTDWTFEVIEILDKENYREFLNKCYNKDNKNKISIKEFVDIREQYWIDEFNSINNGYNSVIAKNIK